MSVISINTLTRSSQVAPWELQRAVKTMPKVWCVGLPVLSAVYLITMSFLY